MQIMNEAFVGRTPEINEMFITFSNARELFMDKKIGKGQKELLKLEKQIEDYFGFGSFSVDIEPDSSINAFTFPIVTSVDVDPSSILKVTSKGYKFDPKANVCSISRITSGLFSNKNFSHAETFAIFLHEIGHSFVNRSPVVDAYRDIWVGQVINSVIMRAILNLWKGPLAWIQSANDIMSITNFGKLVRAEVAKLQKKIPIYRSIKYLVTSTGHKLYDILGVAVSTVLYLTGLPYIMNKMNDITAQSYKSRQYKKNPAAYDRSMERLSDDFANVYGFGSDLATGLIKLDNIDYSKSVYKYLYKCPGLGKLVEVSNGVGYDYIYTFGAHPHSADRILKLIENCEYEIKNDKHLKDKDKKVLKQELQKMKDLAKDCEKMQGELAKNPDVYKQALVQAGFKDGSSEDEDERGYTDMRRINDLYDDLRESVDNYDELYDKYLTEIYKFKDC